MLHDAFGSINFEAEPAYVVTRDILYADDTLLASQSRTNTQNMLNAIVGEGGTYGLVRESMDKCSERPFKHFIILLADEKKENRFRLVQMSDQIIFE